MNRIQCPCCGNYPFESRENALFRICKICFWQYEETAHDKPDKPSGGANYMLSLNKARENYIKYGISDPNYIGKAHIRAPLPEELPENNE